MIRAKGTSNVALDTFPPEPGLRGRDRELATLSRALAHGANKLALVGGGGSGKSVLAAALGHRVARRYGGRLHWFRIGAWDAFTLFEMLARGFGTARDRDERVQALREHLVRSGPRLVVLDNHEDDAATARVLDALGDTNATFVITARRCLLSGVLVFPVTAPLVTTGRPAFPRVAALTEILRWNPLALDIADAIVASRASTPRALATFLEGEGVRRVRVIDHEDDLPEVSLLVSWTWARLSAASRRMLGILAHTEGDHVDAASLAKLSRVTREATRALGALRRWRLVQEPLRGRFALHAVVRYAVQKRTEAAPARLFAHYVSLLEREPERMLLEQTHLFAAMDHANRSNDLRAALRVERLLSTMDARAQGAVGSYFLPASGALVSTLVAGETAGRGNAPLAFGPW